MRDILYSKAQQLARVSAPSGIENWTSSMFPKWVDGALELRSLVKLNMWPHHQIKSTS